MKDIILNYITMEYGNTKHFSSCKFPEEDCSCNLDKITYDTQLISGGYIDSFSMVSVLVFIEKTFGVEIPDADATADNFNTVNKIVELILKYDNNCSKTIISS